MKQRKITISEIAKTAAVSPATVSRVLNHREQVKEDTINQVESAMISLGYHFERKKQVSATEQPLIMLNVPSFQNTFYQEIINGVQASANAHGYQLLIYNALINRGSIRDFCTLLHKTNTRGTILLSPTKEEYLQQINALVPLIQCCEYNENANLPFISIDDYSAARTATEYLISCGKNKIALINGPAIYKYAVERQRGFINALEQADITILNNWIVHLPEINFDMAYTSICRLLNEEIRPDAFFVISDVFAAAAIRAAKRFGLKVPNDIMVVGFDNIPLSQMTTPSITTMSQPQFQLGFSASEMLIDSIEHPEIIQKPLLLDAELIIRESTAAGI